MSIIGKIFAMLTLIFSVLFLGVAATNMAARENYKKKYQQETIARVAQSDRIQQLEEQLSQAVAHYQRQERLVRSEVQRHIDAKKVALHHAELLVQNYTSLQAQISTTTSRLDDMNSKLGDFQGTIDRLQIDSKRYLKDYLDEKKDKNSLRVENSQLKRTIAQAHSDYTDLQDKYYMMMRENETLRQEIEMLRQLLPEGRQMAEWVPPSVSARVIAVDEAVGLVMLSVGSADKIATGQRFAVYRQDQFKAEVAVKKVYPNTCACEVITATQVRPIQAGDDAMPSIGGGR